jgi:hypothetical protein
MIERITDHSSCGRLRDGRLRALEVLVAPREGVVA